jgi:hypothetical protein
MLDFRVDQASRNPDDAAALDAAGLTLVRRGEHDRGIVFLRAAIDCCPNNSAISKLGGCTARFVLIT